MFHSASQIPQDGQDGVALWRYARAVKPDVEGALCRFLPLMPERSGARGRLFNEALQYALFPGGKRLRPILTLLGAEIVGGNRADVLAAAAAVEFVHTSSLIFDDLPCMDNALKRRGKDALHRRYGESLAILAAINLMNASYPLVFEGAAIDERKAIRAHREIVECIGASGMVTGQVIDLAPNRNGEQASDGGSNADAARNLKTSALMRMALRVGAILSGANERQLATLSTFAELLGQAYQISDDVLDLSEDTTLGTDGRIAVTFAVERGAQQARARIGAFVREAQNLLSEEFGETTPALLLCQFADYIESRVRSLDAGIE
jgi:geranylgeranyl diphosphate synthase type II